MRSREDAIVKKPRLRAFQYLDGGAGRFFRVLFDGAEGVGGRRGAAAADALSGAADAGRRRQFGGRQRQQRRLERRGDAGAEQSDRRDLGRRQLQLGRRRRQLQRRRRRRLVNFAAQQEARQLQGDQTAALGTDITHTMLSLRSRIDRDEEETNTERHHSTVGQLLFGLKIDSVVQIKFRVEMNWREHVT